MQTTVFDSFGGGEDFPTAKRENPMRELRHFSPAMLTF